MTEKKTQRLNVFRHAWEIIDRDDSLPPEEKKGILKLIQILVEISDASPRPESGETKLQTHEIVSRHSLMALVKQQAEELNALRNLSLNLTSSLDLQTVLDAVVTEAMRLVKYTRSVYIFLYSHGKLTFGAARHDGGFQDEKISQFQAEQLAYQVAAGGEKVVIEDMSSHPLYQAQGGSGSVIGVPLKFSNSIVGVMNLSRFTAGGFTRAELRLISLLADQAAVAISNASLHKMVAEQANTDILTGLPNRRALEDRLQEEIRYAKRMKSQFSVVMMDLDGFKAINDQYGHAVGDEVLNAVSAHLAAHVRPTDFLARYGGDELTLLIREAGLESAAVVTNKLINLMKDFEFPYPGKAKNKLGITAGIAVYPIHAQNAGDLLRAADASLYQGKKHNRGSYVVAKGVMGPLRPIKIGQSGGTK
ncbi:MAG: sensor domain-containing diguanylate cyclase [Chloroflexi bacterium]|nr:sensor domain-containing diguanylate cyclase [Chloroflexota bacterium]